jgi:uncharacterized protein (TIGR02271 family)
MTTMQRMVVVVIDNHTQAEQAVNDLQNAGFSDNQIRFAGHGASTGGILEKIKSLFTGQEIGAVYDDLVSMGVPPDDASYYQREYEAGHSLVAVLADGRMQEATDILVRYGGYGASRRFAQTADTASAASTGVQEAKTEGEQSIRLREEELRVHKQQVVTGEVVIRKEVITEEKTITVPVTREELVIERRPGSGELPAQPVNEGETFEEALKDGGTLRIVLREEQVRVEKYPVVKEEIFISKRQIQKTRHISDTVKREEAHLERVGNVNIHGSEVEDSSHEPECKC